MSYNFLNLDNSFKVSGIYSITDKAKNRIYIGSSNSIYRRVRFEHLSQLNRNIHDNIYLQRCFNKHGVDNFKIDIIEIVKESELSNREQHYIDIFYGKKCFNINKLADRPTPSFTKETKTKMSISAKARGTHKSICNKVYQYSINGVYIRNYNSCRAAARHLNLPSVDGTNISNCALGKKNEAYGYIWKYNKQDNLKLNITLKNIITNEEIQFLKISHIAKYLNIDNSCVSRGLSHKYMVLKKYKIYKNEQS